MKAWQGLKLARRSDWTLSDIALFFLFATAYFIGRVIGSRPLPMLGSILAKGL